MLRKATTQDLDEIVALVSSAPEAPQWSPAIWLQMLQVGPEGHRHILLLEQGSQMLGLVVFTVIAGLVEIESILAASNARRKGVGIRLMQALLLQSLQAGAESVELEVRESNQAARSFYEALGLREQGRRSGYYDTPIEDAVLMSCKLSVLNAFFVNKL